VSWFAASNDCLSRGGSLAVFTDIGRPSDNSQLTSWLTSSGTDKTYWIGLVRSWWKTTDNGNLFRPPGTVVPGRPYVLQRFFFFFFHREISEVRGPSSAKFCHIVGNMFSLQMPVRKFGSLPLPKKRNGGGGQKHAKFGPILDTFPL